MCDPDLLAITSMLDDMPRKLRLLPLLLVPGQSPAGDRVSTSRVGSPTPAALDALSLVGPGATAVPGAPRELVRRWSTTREVHVAARVGTYRVDEHTTVLTEWHQEIVRDGDGEPVLVSDDDQLGIMPPVEWLAQQVTGWRAVFGHHRPAPAGRGPRVPSRGYRLGRTTLAWLSRYAPDLVVDVATAGWVTDMYRQGVTDLITGREPGYAGSRPAGLREDDPVADLWQVRFGEPAATSGALADIAYLRTWLGQAADHDQVDMAGFAAELRALTAELTRVLGEKPDQQRLGKCPAGITDHATGDSSTCGAELWQDPHASVVECPRCHSSWGPRTIHLMHLAAEIRRVWPLDRRRRYSAEEIDALKPIRCPGCGLDDIEIGWQEVTGVGDNQRWWRPTRTRCSNGCPRATEVMG